MIVTDCCIIPRWVPPAPSAARAQHDGNPEQRGDAWRGAPGPTHPAVAHGRQHPRHLASQD